MKFLLHCNCLSAIMDFTHLNYCYPGTPNAARLHFNASQQLQESLHHAPIQSIRSMQEQTNPRDGHVWSDPSRITHPRPSLGFTADYDLHPKQKSDPVGPRSAIHSHPTGPTKVHCVDGSADLSDQYIPSSSDKITCTDHRPLDDIFGNVWPSSGRSCATSGRRDTNVGPLTWQCVRPGESPSTCALRIGRYQSAAQYTLATLPSVCESDIRFRHGREVDDPC
ncbi:hypothetical protein HD554DRAFT_1595839 [Boletus coccyginus]|nr:hypothetical protein HD554DRAFT_1595839 [Boletus coccyginus]